MAKKSIYTRRLGRVVANSAKSGNLGIYHVIPAQADKWTVVAEGRVKPVKAFATRRDAVLFAKEVAIIKTGEVIVHGTNGKILSRVTY